MRPTIEVGRLHRDPLRAKISGVCAGLARHWQLPTLGVRIAAIVCLVMLPLPTVCAYTAAAILLPKR
jgi:phage shock protein PspC (stress-responsive transcriptional regulator)